jgi:hypothetical protein
MPKHAEIRADRGKLFRCDGQQPRLSEGKSGTDF